VFVVGSEGSKVQGFKVQGFMVQEVHGSGGSWFRRFMVQEVHGSGGSKGSGSFTLFKAVH
jgi:hypothetical protein